MRIVGTETLVETGPFAVSQELYLSRQAIHQAIDLVVWPHGAELFTIYPESGRLRGCGNGVRPIKEAAINHLYQNGWRCEYPWPGINTIRPGKMDAAFVYPEGVIALEWETGNISSSHRSLNKMCLGLLSGVLKAGFLIIPSRELYGFLTDRIANISELMPYFPLWQGIACTDGVLELIVVEHDSVSWNVPRIPKGTDGRALC